MHSTILTDLLNLPVRRRIVVVVSHRIAPRKFSTLGEQLTKHFLNSSHIPIVVLHI